MKETAKEIERRILLVEDSRADAVLIRQAFDILGAKVRLDVIADSVSAVETLRKSSRLPDLVLLDVNMPKKSGCEILKEIRSDARLKKLPIVVLTTSNYQKDVHCAYDCGANSYILKPWGMDELVRVVKVILDYWFGVVCLPDDE